jgi:hypothetical protein
MGNVLVLQVVNGRGVGVGVVCGVGCWGWLPPTAGERLTDGRGFVANLTIKMAEVWHD